MFVDSFLVHSAAATYPRSDVIIAFLGLPGAGKSTLAHALGQVTNALVLPEPGESAWPAFVVNAHPKGAFTSLSWFRSQRVPLYYQAAEHSASGGTAILDSYYDKWCTGWLGKPGLEWLIDPSDPYLPAAKLVALTDAAELPSADAVIALEIDETLWNEQVKARGRTIDRDSRFLESHNSQRYFTETALELGPPDGTIVIQHRRERTTALDEARLIVGKLRAAGISFPRR